MEQPFTLILPVQNVETPHESPESDNISVRVTLRHTAAHIKHLIWMFSPENKLKPVFLRLKYNSESVSDSLLLSKVFSVRNTLDVPVDHGLSLVIDHTLSKSAAIPHRDPVPDFFDVEVIYDTNPVCQVPSTYFIRESLLSSVLSIKELAAIRYKLAPERFDLFYANEQLPGDLTLREVLQLDVPPLSTVKFGLKRRIVNYVISVQPKPPATNPTPLVLNVKEDISIREFKAEISQITGVSASQLELYVKSHCFSKALDGGDAVRLLEIFSLKQDPETDPEILFSIKNDEEVDPKIKSIDDSEQKTQEPFLLPPSETYELEVNGKTLDFSTSECILNPGGQILFNAQAMAKLAESGITLKPQVSHVPFTLLQTIPSSKGRERSESPDSYFFEGTSSFFTNANNSNVLLNEPTISEDRGSVIGRPLVSSEALNSQFSGENQDDLAQEQQEADVDEDVNTNQRAPIQEVAENVDIRRNESVFRILLDILNQHRLLIFQLVLQIGFTVFVMGVDLLGLVHNPTILTILGITSTMTAFFMFGGEISDWLEDNVLIHGNPNLFDYAILRCVSLLFRSATLLNERISWTIGKQCIGVLGQLHQTRTERLEEEMFRNPLICAIKRLSLQTLELFFIAAATILPFLEHEITKFYEEEHYEDGLHVKRWILEKFERLKATDELERVKSMIQAELRTLIEDLLHFDETPELSDTESIEDEAEDTNLEEEKEEEKEELLRLYLLLRWFERNKQADELPLVLRRGNTAEREN